MTVALSDGARRFADRFPVVWHVIEAEGLASARELGLLPAAALRAGAGLPASALNRADFELLAWEGRHRAVLRFQQMQDQLLLPTLHGRFAGDPAAWRAFIDQHVFFWATEERRDGFRRASRRVRANSTAAPPTADAPVLALDTATLLARHEADAVFSCINSGSTVRGGGRARRDENTFQPVASFRGGKAAELAVSGPVRLDGLLIPSP